MAEPCTHALEDELLEEFPGARCAISHNLMLHPVITPSGNSYDYPALEDWLKVKQTDPITQDHLELSELRFNRAVHDIVSTAVARRERRKDPRASALAQKLQQAASDRAQLERDARARQKLGEHVEHFETLCIRHARWSLATSVSAYFSVMGCSAAHVFGLASFVPRTLRALLEVQQQHPKSPLALVKQTGAALFGAVAGSLAEMFRVQRDALAPEFAATGAISTLAVQVLNKLRWTAEPVAVQSPPVFGFVKLVIQGTILGPLAASFALYALGYTALNLRLMYHEARAAISSLPSRMAQVERQPPLLRRLPPLAMALTATLALAVAGRKTAIAARRGHAVLASVLFPKAAS